MRALGLVGILLIEAYLFSSRIRVRNIVLVFKFFIMRLDISLVSAIERLSSVHGTC